MVIHACTIVARNYLSAAHVLMSSFHEHHPQCKFTVLVVDDIEHAVTSELFEVLHPDQLDIPKDELLRMAAIYDVMEFCTALKPWLLDKLLDGDASAAIYLDPDIYTYSSLEEIPELAAAHGIVLTPHVIGPMPRDGLLLSERDILAVGMYNLGFIAVSRDAGPFISFWKDRLRRDCIVDRPRMRFVDQRWVDFAPALYSSYILRDPGCNVAYWNLHERTVSFQHGRYFVNGVNLRFFHFSGYNPATPYLLSKYQGDQPRILLSARPDIARLCEEYRAHLTAQDYYETARIRYTFGRLNNGIIIDPVMRKLYRRALVQAEREDQPLPPNPFESDDPDAFVDWLTQPFDGADGTPLTRYLGGLHASRPDLQKAFPDPEGSDFHAFVAWAQHEADTGRLPPVVAPQPLPTNSGAPLLDAPQVHVAGPTRTGASSSEVRSDPPPAGIRVAGYLRAESGVGQQGRLALGTVEFAGIPASSYIYDVAPNRQRHDFSGPVEDLNVNLVCVNADQLPNFARRVGQGFFDNHYTIGLWAWEVEEFPESLLPAFEYVDEVWSSSEFSRKAIARIAPKPVYAFPLPVTEPDKDIYCGRAELGVPDGFMFLFCFDMLSVFERKNPIGVISAFDRAFAPNEGPVLVVKVINGESSIPALEQLRWEAARRPDIVVIDHYLDGGAQSSLMGACDCYVSLHRSEGFGLTLAEAMALGKPVIATGYSGNLDFMTPETSFLVPYTSGTVRAGSEPYPVGAPWAEPDLDFAARAMREVYENPVNAAEVGRLAKYHIFSDHGFGARAGFVAERFTAAQAELARRQTNKPDAISTDEGRSGSLVDLTRGRPSLDAPSRHPHVARLLRRVVWRALKSYDDYQRAINVRVAEGVERSLAAADHAGRQLSSLQERLDALQGSLEGSLAVYRAGLKAQQGALAGQQEALTRQEEALTRQEEALTGQQESLDAQRVRLSDIDQSERWQKIEESARSTEQLHAIPYMSDPSLLVVTDELGRSAIGYRRENDLGAGHIAFDNVFRGPESLIRDKLRPYLRILEGHAPVVDVGCGRGEMLDLLSNAGVSSIGVDIDPVVVERAKSKGHDVREQDGIEYLVEQPDESLGAIFAAQMIEHLPAEVLLRLLKEAHRTLRSDGLLVLETVNPYSIQAFKAFWTDLTHRNPIYPEPLLVYCSEAGFREAMVIFPNGSDDLAVDRWSQGEFAVVARKLAE